MIISEERNSLPGRKYFISGLNREFFMISAEEGVKILVSMESKSF